MPLGSRRALLLAFAAVTLGLAVIGLAYADRAPEGHIDRFEAASATQARKAAEYEATQMASQARR